MLLPLIYLFRTRQGELGLLVHLAIQIFAVGTDGHHVLIGTSVVNKNLVALDDVGALLRLGSKGQGGLDGLAFQP